VAELLDAALRAGKPTFANLKPAAISAYQRVSLVTLNQSEAEAVTGFSLCESGDLDQAGRCLLKACASEAVIITLGARGLVLFERDGPGRHLPVLPVEVYDPCGCGDSAIAAATMARIAGAEWVEAAMVANLAGNAKVRKLGVVPVTREDIELVYASTCPSRRAPRLDALVENSSQCQAQPAGPA
jgi:bifunctional ADP-heptose synthase (sugar kinase/adenylyltransferase)